MRTHLSLFGTAAPGPAGGFLLFTFSEVSLSAFCRFNKFVTARMEWEEIGTARHCTAPRPPALQHSSALEHIDTKWRRRCRVTAEMGDAGGRGTELLSEQHTQPHSAQPRCAAAACIQSCVLNPSTQEVCCCCTKLASNARSQRSFSAPRASIPLLCWGITSNAGRPI